MLPGLVQREVEGKMVFDGLVAKPDGSQCYKVHKDGAWEHDAAVAVCRQAGEELKEQAGEDFFAGLKVR